MSGDSSKPFDPIAQLAEMQTLMRGFFDPLNPLKLMSSSSFLPYQTIDPQVQEIAILATMHNMASMLRDPGRIKAVLSAELSERAKKLDAK